jgi:ABC-type multidrug transport system fused ATPase/permease subunit
MTATEAQPLDVPEDDWRGRVKDSQDDELPIDESVPRRREARALLGSLLWPYRLNVALLALVVIVENLARLSVPLLVQRGIDEGIPPILAGGSAHTLMVVVGVLSGMVVIQATSRMFFLQRSGRIGQKVLLELRRRVYRHFQRLDIAFHERYTSGRVVSRSTNDVEAIQDMLETGFDSLITAVLTLIGTSILLVSGGVPGSRGAGVVVSQRVGQDLPQGAGERRAGDRAVRRDDDRHQGGAGLPARAAQPGDLRRHRRSLQSG